MIELDKESYDADKEPLFIGLSVTPYVYFKKRTEGPNAGQFLQKLATEAAQQKPPQGRRPPAAGRRGSNECRDVGWCRAN